MCKPITRDATAAGGSPWISTSKLAKAFGATRALRSASLDLLPGEVHAIVGENGSGKSTLVKILAGVHRPDAGTVRLPDGGEAAAGSPAAALAAGVATVFQEVLVVGSRSVLDNVFAGYDTLLRRRLSDREKRRRAQILLDELLGAAPPLDQLVEELSLSDRQAVAIARSLARSPRVLILDEATSALDIATRDRLFQIVRRLAEDGSAIVFISHRMDEVREIADRITVMRSGQTVGCVPRGGATIDELVRMMTGDEHLTGDMVHSRSEGRVGNLLLEGTAIRLRPGAAPFEFHVRAGELVGLAGLEGMGQDALLHVLRGAAPGCGNVVIGEDRRAVDHRRTALKLGIAYVPRERRGEALFEALSIRSNFALPTVAQDSSIGLVRPRVSERRFNQWSSTLGIKLGRSKDDIGTLSGGNQQKVVLARWLAAQPRVLLLNDPTRGVDIGAKRDIYRLLESLAAEGMAIVMLSTEVDEHIELMDRVLVFREHELAAEIPRAELSRERLVQAFFSVAEEPGKER